MQKHKKMQEKQELKEKGITLISLVITIIVLLILAGVTLSTLTGDSGILSNAEKAKKDTEKANLKEEVSLKVIEAESSIKEGNVLEERLNEMKNVTIEKIGEDTFYVTKGNTTLTLYENGKIIDGKAVWDGKSSEIPKFKEFNWYIYTPAQLKFLADFVNSGQVLTQEQEKQLTAAGYSVDDVRLDETTTVYLMNDLDLGAREVNGKWEGETVYGDKTNEDFKWIPIGQEKAETGEENKKFKATFEGNGNTIRGVYVNEEEYFNGIFGNTYESTIKNLTIENSYIQGASCTGGIVGAFRYGTLENCHNINTTVILRDGPYNAVGGIAGQVQGVVLNCSNTGKIQAIGKELEKNISNAGGIAGLGKDVTISNCHNTGRVTSEGDCVAGIIAASAGGGEVHMSNCYNIGTIKGEGDTGGGIISIIYKTTVQQCYNKGSVSIKGNSVGGIVGDVAVSTVQQCYNKGTVTGGTGVGAVIGRDIQQNTLNHLYYLNTVGVELAISNKTENDESNYIMEINKNITSYKQFIEWIEKQIENAD